MKIVLLMLSGDAKRACDRLQKEFPSASIEIISRETIEKWTATQRVRMLRSRKPELFAVMTERLVWQRGQEPLLLLGALAGARRSIIFDEYGAWREKSRRQTLAEAPARLAHEFILSSRAIRRAHKQLTQLERAVGADRGQTKPSSRAAPANLSIAFIRASPGPGTQAGGAASHINGFVNAALQLGANISLISNDEIAGLDAERLQVKIVWPTTIGSTRAAFDIYNNELFTEATIAEIERQQPDFIYQRYARFSWSGVAASLQTERPLFLEYNGSEVWVGKHWDRIDKLDLLARYERLNLKAAARIFVVSEVERQNLLQAGIDDEKIVVNPNGVDTDRFQPNIGGAEWRHENGIARDETLVGFVGTFGPWHGVEVLADAIVSLPPDLNLRFLFVGGGALQPAVEQRLRDAGLAGRAIFTGSIAHERVPQLLDACDILVSPHVPLVAGREFFGSPTKLYEYMAMGKAIVASHLGQIGDVLSDGQTALLVQPGNVSELAAAIVRLAESPALRERVGAAARTEAIVRHTWTHNARRVLDAYQSLTEDDK